MDAREFITTLFGSLEGFFFISTKNTPEEREILNHKPFLYPIQMNAAIKYLDMRHDEDVYITPSLFLTPWRRRSSIAHTPVAYADTDSFPISKYLVPPSINVQTSPGRHASFWILDGDYPTDTVETLNHMIALAHADVVDGKQAGVDQGGWDITQLLRVPDSLNLKHRVEGHYDGYTEPYEVKVDDDLSPLTVYSLEEMQAAYSGVQTPVQQRASMDMPTELPTVGEVIRKLSSYQKLSEMYGRDAAGVDDRSTFVYRFVCEMLRHGFTPAETFQAGWSMAANKYRASDRPMSDFWNYDMRKALADPRNVFNQTHEVAYGGDDEYLHPKDEGVNTAVAYALLKEGEFTTPTFVDQYVKWASGKTDAPIAYHIASALVVLSLVYGGYGNIYPSFGRVKLGLSMVVMGETTETRKSTSRNLMKKFLKHIRKDDDEYLLTSDATPEALIDALSERENQTSMYDRDEAQQLIHDVKGGKGYMAGFFETLNELYDGQARGRMRVAKRTKETEITFVQYFMGIRSQIQDNLELHDFASGWGPRNIYVRGETPARTRENSMIKQGVPGVHNLDDEMYGLADAMDSPRGYWERQNIDPAEPHLMLFTDEAWAKAGSMQWDLRRYFAGHDRFDTLRPCFERMEINAMKVAALLAMSRASPVVELQDVINTQSYVSQWVEDLIIVVEGVARSYYMRDIKAATDWVEDHGGYVKQVALKKWLVSQGSDLKQAREVVQGLIETGVVDVSQDEKNKESLKLLKPSAE